MSDGKPATDMMWTAAIEYGIDLSTHRARKLTVDDIADAELESEQRVVTHLPGVAEFFYAASNGRLYSIDVDVDDERLVGSEPPVLRQVPDVVGHEEIAVVAQRRDGG